MFWKNLKYFQKKLSENYKKNSKVSDHKIQEIFGKSLGNVLEKPEILLEKIKRKLLKKRHGIRPQNMPSINISFISKAQAFSRKRLLCVKLHNTGHQCYSGCTLSPREPETM